ncbi:hypothetical protein D3C85_799640 [compost metagenome]
MRCSIAVVLARVSSAVSSNMSQMPALTYENQAPPSGTARHWKTRPGTASVRLTTRSAVRLSLSDMARTALMSVVVPIIRSALPAASRLITLPRLQIHL